LCTEMVSDTRRLMMTVLPCVFEYTLLLEQTKRE
jgi:hypothetical protein